MRHPRRGRQQRRFDGRGIQPRGAPRAIISGAAFAAAGRASDHRRHSISPFWQRRNPYATPALEVDWKDYAKSPRPEPQISIASSRLDEHYERGGSISSDPDDSNSRRLRLG